MGQLKYRATIIDLNALKENLFFYSKAFSDTDDPVYIHRFPVYRWGLITTLEAELRLHLKNNLVTADVYDGQNMMTRGVYAPFYYQVDNCHDEIVDRIISEIDEECERLGFIREES